MSEKLMKLVVDLAKGTQEYIELTPAEIAERDQMAAQAAEEQTKREEEAAKLAADKESAKAKLAALGLTEDEVKALDK